MADIESETPRYPFGTGRCSGSVQVSIRREILSDFDARIVLEANIRHGDSGVCDPGARRRLEAALAKALRDKAIEVLGGLREPGGVR